MKKRDTYPGATLRLPQAGINPRRWRSTAIWGYGLKDWEHQIYRGFCPRGGGGRNVIRVIPRDTTRGDERAGVVFLGGGPARPAHGGPGDRGPVGDSQG